jgi:MFS family permease
LSSESRFAIRILPGEAYLWYVVLFLTCASTLAYIDRQILALMIGPVKRDLGISDTQIGLLVGLAFSLFYCAVTVPIAWLADVSSRRAVIGAGILSWSVLTGLSGLAQNYAQLFLARMGVGLGEATLGPAAYSLLSDYFPRERLPLAVAVFATAPFIGVGLANMLGGGLVELLETLPPVDLPLVGAVRSWQVTFFVVGAPGLLLALLTFSIREPGRRGRMRLHVLQGAAAPWAEVFAFMRQNGRLFALHFVGFLFLAMQGWTIFAWLIEFFVRVHGMSRAAIGFTYGAIALSAGLTGSVTAGQIATSLLRRGSTDGTMRLTVVAACIMAPLAVVMPLISEVRVAVGLLIPLTFFMAWPPGLGVAALQAVTPNELRGRVIAFYLLFVNFLSFTLGPFLVGFFNDSVFHSEAAIGRTLSTLAAASYPLAALTLIACLSPFRAAVARAREWE